MGVADVVLELGLIGLLVVTLVHCVRLQRTLGSLRQDRAALHDAIAGFDTGTRQAEAGLSRLRAVADELGAQVARAATLQDDLALLSDRGNAVADRLDTLVRAGRAAVPPMPQAAPAPTPWSGLETAQPVPGPAPGKLRSAAERNLMQALQARR